MNTITLRFTTKNYFESIFALVFVFLFSFNSFGKVSVTTTLNSNNRPSNSNNIYILFSNF